MKPQIDKNATYFCYDSYSTANRPKLEAELFERAKTLVLYRTIEGCFVKDILDNLERSQRLLKEEHPNWKETEVSVYGGQDGLFWLNIGAGNLRFREIRGEY